MRISTNTMFDGATARLGQLQSNMDRTVQQLNSGKKIQTAADDPVAASRALDVQQATASNAQYKTNRTNVRNSLTVADGAMTSIADSLQVIHEQVVQAGNGTLSDDNRSSIAQALQGQLDQIKSQINSRDASGNYLFSGYQTDKPPFADDGSGKLRYQGDQGQQLVAVDDSRKLAMNEAGSVLLPDDKDGANILNRLQSAIAALQPGQDQATRQSALTALGNSYTATLSSITRSQASVGTRLNELDQLDTRGSDREVEYAAISSSLQDLDYTKSLSDLSRQQLVLQAAQKTFQQVSSLSLFNYLS